MRTVTSRLHLDLRHAMVVIGAALIAMYLLVGVNLGRGTQAGIDFLPTYSAGTAVAHGHPAEMYDRAAELRAHAAILPGHTLSQAPFLNPPGAALLVAPLSALPFSAAYLLWALLQTVLLGTGALLLCGRRPRGELVAPAVFCLGGVWCFLDVVLGQWDGVTLLGLALCWRLRAQDRMVAAGLALGLLGGLAKPHLLVGVAAYLLVRREWRLVAAAAAGALAVIVVPALLLSPHLLVDFVRTMGSSGVDPLSQRFVSLSGLVYSWFGITALSRLAGLVLSAVAVCVAGWLGTRRAGDPLRREAAVVALSLLVSPHLLSYDPVLLLPFLIAILAEGQRRLVLVAGLLLLDAASWLDFGNVTLFPPGRLTTPVLCALAGWWVWESGAAERVGGEAATDRAEQPVMKLGTAPGVLGVGENLAAMAGHDPRWCHPRQLAMPHPDHDLGVPLLRHLQGDAMDEAGVPA
jgi:alpha-1,2-mannosyltransferase